MSNTLVLFPPAPDFRTRFLEAPGEAPNGFEALHRSWSRSRVLGAELDPAPSRGAPAPRAEELLRSARQDCLEIGSELGRKSVALVLADAGGTLLEVLAPEDDRDALLGVGAETGVDWSEAAMGTNAIGTSLAEGRAVVAIGGAHLAPRLGGWSTVAAPIRAALGEHVGAVGLLAQDTDALANGDALVRALALAIERRLQGRAYDCIAPRLLASAAALTQRIPEATLLVVPPGRVQALNPAAGRLFGRALRTLGYSALEELLGRDFDALVELGVSGRDDELEIAGPGEQPRSVRLECEPVIDDRNRVVAVFVTLGGTAAEIRGAARPEMDLEQASPEFDVLIGSDARLREATALASRFARTRLSVMILSETGTGKELMAGAIHAASDRADHDLVALNCGALPGNLLESELFGYAPGAFTGARKNGDTGKLEAADGGTLFLDEVADMPASLQIALLRFLEDGSFYRVGDNRQRSADVRVICATSQPLEDMVAQGTFRQDLYYRLKGVLVRMPSLRERTDLPELASGLLRTVSRELQRSTPPVLDADVLELLERHDWPGNVRELRSVLHHALVMAGVSGILRAEHLPRELHVAPVERAPEPRPQPALDPGYAAEIPPVLPPAAPTAHAQPFAPTDPATPRPAPMGVPIQAAPVASASSLEQVRLQAFLDALARHAGNVSAAARELGVARSTIYRALARHEANSPGGH